MLFNASERKGILVILFLITGLIILPRHFLSRDPALFLLPIPMEKVEELQVSLNDSTSHTKTPLRNRQQSLCYPVELNSADSSTLVKIKGIGPYYASKIVRYRERLGGFQSVEQLKELKMTYFPVDSCAHLFTVNTALIRKADMDTMSFKALLRHPYLEYEDVQLLFIAKRKYGHISYSVLEKNKVLVPHKLKKIHPYFK